MKTISPQERERLIGIIRRVIAADLTDSYVDTHALADELTAGTHHPRPLDVMNGNEGEAGTPDEMLDCMLAYEPMITPPPRTTEQ